MKTLRRFTFYIFSFVIALFLVLSSSVSVSAQSGAGILPGSSGGITPDSGAGIDPGSGGGVLPGGSGAGVTGGSGAGIAPCNPAREFCNPIQSRDFTELISRVAGLLARLGIPIVGVVLVYAGFLFVSARGNEEQLAHAKRAFFWAVIGAALVLGAFVIAAALANFAGRL